MDRCWKIHGYPSNNMPNTWKRNEAGSSRAHVAQLIDDPESPINLPAQHLPTHLTPSQYQQLLDLIQKGDNSTNHSTSSAVAETRNVALLAGKLCLLAHDNASKWIIDSGASDHMCCDLKMFHDYRNLNENDHNITIPNGTKVGVKCIGTMILSNGVRLCGVLYVPDFHFNFISVQKLTKDTGYQIVFTTNECFIQDHLMNKSWILGKIQHGLYYVESHLNNLHGTRQLTNSIPVQNFCNAGQFVHNTISDHDTSKAKLWHLRLGHMPFQKLSLLFPNEVSNACTSEFFCTICPAARQTRTAFTSSSIQSVFPLSMIHVDTWCPYKHATRFGHHMFITIVDDYSRATWIYLIKHKSDFITVLKQFITYAERQFGSKVQIIRSDNALELTEGEALIFYKMHGIQHQTSCIDTPQ